MPFPLVGGVVVNVLPRVRSATNSRRRKSSQTIVVMFESKTFTATAPTDRQKDVNLGGLAKERAV